MPLTPLFPPLARCRARHRLALLAAILGSLLALRGAVADDLQADYDRVWAGLATGGIAGLPVQLRSVEAGDLVTGEIYAVVDHSFPVLPRELRSGRQWCEVLILHLNVHDCLPAVEGSGKTRLDLRLGRKGEGSDGRQTAVSMVLTVERRGADRFHVRMDADEGPFGTRDYRLDLEAMPLASGRSFVKLAYSYSMSDAARLAASTYYRTLGRNKVGFTVTGSDRAGEPRYISGVRGALERNVMRYYLALDTYLRSKEDPAATGPRWRFVRWYEATQRYARQLGELGLDEYLDSKQPWLARR